MKKSFAAGSRGMTIVELMVALFLASIATYGMYRTYTNTIAVYNLQEQLVEITQNMRLTLELMGRDLRMAGYDPSGSSGAGFVTVGSTTVTFSMDLNGNGVTSDSGEAVSYNFAGSALEKDSLPVLDNVDAVQFVYFDEDGAATAAAANVRKVQVSLVVRSSLEDPSYIDSESYLNPQGSTVYTAGGDNYHRRILSEQIYCRNLGF